MDRDTLRRGQSYPYKHTPQCGETKHKFTKKKANRVVHRSKLTENCPNHAGYKKMFCRWDICDYETVGMTFERFFADEVDLWYRWQHNYGEPFPTREEARKEYEKWYVRK